MSDGEIAAVVGNTEHQCDDSARWLLYRRLLGGITGRADAPGSEQRSTHASALLHQAELREWRLERRLKNHWQQDNKWLAATVYCQEQPDYWLEQRRLEPGVFWCRGRARPVLPRCVIVWWPVHHARDQPGDTRGAIPVHRFQRERQRLRPFSPDEHLRHDLGERRNPWFVHPDQQVLHRPAERLRGDNQ